MNTEKRFMGRPLTILAGSAMLIVLCLLQPAAVKAQWTTNGNNINNTNSAMLVSARQILPIASQL